MTVEMPIEKLKLKATEMTSLQAALFELLELKEEEVVNFIVQKSATIRTIAEGSEEIRNLLQEKKYEEAAQILKQELDNLESSEVEEAA